MNTTFIYTLKDPETGGVRYVGKSNSPKTRYRRHLTDGSEENHHRANWLKSLAALGTKPILEIIDEVLVSEWPSAEAAYIDYFRELGCDLVNTTGGGEAGPCWNGAKHHFFGKNLPPEHCKKLSVAHKGKKHTLEQIEKIRIGNQNTKRTPEYRKKVSLNRRGVRNERNTSGFVGVCFVKNLGKWWARIDVEGKTIPLGYYKDKYDAVFVRRLAEDKYFV